MNLKTVLLVLVLFLSTAASTDTEGPALVPEFNREGKVLTIQVMVYDTHEQVTEAKHQAFPQDAQEPLYGWSAWSRDDKGVCVVNVAKADKYMDKEFIIWGHELAHCLYGNYHRELDASSHE